MTYLIVCPLLFIAGYIDSIAGGGGLISLPAFLITGLPIHSAIATNKLSSSIGTSVSTARYAKLGYIPWKIALVCAAFSMTGANIGAKLSLLTDDFWLKIALLLLIPVIAFLVLKNKEFKTEKALSPSRTLVIASASAFIIGAYDGFYGPGTGTFLILALTSFARMDLSTANGVTKVINLSSNIAALAVYLLNGKVIIPLGLAAGFSNALGNYFGSLSFSKKGSAAVIPVVISVLSIFFIRLILEVFGII